MQPSCKTIGITLQPETIQLQRLCHIITIITNTTIAVHITTAITTIVVHMNTENMSTFTNTSMNMANMNITIIITIMMV